MSVRRLQTLLLNAIIVVLALLFIAPVVWAIASSFKAPAEIITNPFRFGLQNFTLDSYRRAFADIPLGTGFVNTAIVLLIKGGLTMTLAPLAGFAFAKYEFRGKNLFFGLVLVTLMLPVLVLIIPLLLQMSSLNLVDTLAAIILPGCVDAFSIFWMRQAIAGVPNDLLDAARVDGTSEWGMYWRIVLPVIRPALAGLAVLTTMNIYNDFVWPVVAVTSEQHQTLQVVLSTVAQNIAANRIGADFATSWGELLAASSLAMLPLLVIFLLLQKHFIAGIMAGSIKN